MHLYQIFERTLFIFFFVETEYLFVDDTRKKILKKVNKYKNFKPFEEKSEFKIDIISLYELSLPLKIAWLLVQ